LEPSNKEKGDFGEKLVLAKYLNEGCSFVAKNFTTRSQKMKSEIDFIVKNYSDLIFVEVKTRTIRSCGYGEQAVNFAKKRKLKMGVDFFRLRHPEFDEFFPRVDIAVVEIKNNVPRIEIFENISLN